MPCRKTRLPEFVLLALLAASAAGCVGARAGARGGLPQNPSSPQQAPTGYAQPVVEPRPADSEIEEAIHSARTFFELGRQRYQRGEMIEARKNFDQAIETLTSFPEGARGDSRLSDAYVDLLGEVQDLETSSYQNGSGLSPATEPPPLDDLDEIVAEISPEKAAEERQTLENAGVKSDPPVVYNDKVLAWLDIYRFRMHDRFQEGLTRSGRYIDMIRGIFREEGLPEDLAYMAHVESAYKPTAYSRARAKGVWQFIVGTGTRYGLRRDWWIDERSDPELATRAAAAYLKDLYEMFGDWYLAMAAYNAGEGKIQRAIEHTGQRDFWSIAATRQIRQETKNYVPAILAAITISKDPEKFGFTKEKEPPVIYDRVAIDSATDLRVVARLADTSIDDLKRLNPGLARLQTPPNYPDFELRLPPGSGEKFAAAFTQLPLTERIPWKSHTVSAGDTLASLSRRYGVSVARIRDANGLGPTARLRTGNTLQIPTFVAPAAEGHGDITRVAYETRSSGSGQKVVHKVRKGDTLASIARRYKTTVGALRGWNDLSGNTRLRAGDRIVVFSGRSNGSARDSAPAQPMAKASIGGTEAAPKSASARGSAKAAAPHKTYLVKPGDTLYRIATRMSTTVERLCRVNNLSISDALIPGTILTIER